MDLERARESLNAAVLCLREGYENSAASRAYYAMFQAAQVALEHAGAGRMVWSHHGLHAAFTTELIHRRKRYPAILRNYLMSGLEIRQAADYGYAGVSRKVAQRLGHRASTFVAAVEEELSHGSAT
jgi:uncharacterized protein (UPF0332 family)